mmetsp:Transcript_12311/g.22278  ORF Transcript_12311/g.22278 Transcript_12311/m.22278 type:complete len:250 (-) Transcript_12311:856-1605(-)
MYIFHRHCCQYHIIIAPPTCLRILIIQSMNTRRHLPLQQIQTSSAPRRNMRHPPRMSAHLRGLCTRPTSHNTQQSPLLTPLLLLFLITTTTTTTPRRPISHRLGNRERSRGVRRYFEHAHGSVPHRRSTRRYASLVQFDGARTDIERHVSVGHVGIFRDERTIRGFARRVTRVIDRQQHLHVARLRLDQKALREIVDIPDGVVAAVLVAERLTRFVKGIPDRTPHRLEKRVRHRTAHDQVIDLVEYIVQ